MPLDEARMRAILGLAADADVEAAVAQLVAGKLAGQAATPPAGTTPAPAAAVPAAPATPTPVAAPVAAAPAAPAAVPAPAAAAPAAVIPAAAAPAAAVTPPAAVIPPASPAAGDLPAGMVLISEGVLNELRTGSQAAVTAAGIIEDAQVERELVGAFRAGKVTVHEMPQWRAMLGGPGKAQARALLGAMAPKFAAGGGTGTELGLPANIDDAQWDAFDEAIFGLATPAPATNGAA